MARAPIKRQDSGSRRVTFSDAPAAVAPAAPAAAAQTWESSSEEGDGRPDGPLIGDGTAGPPPPSGWYARFKAAVRALKQEVLSLYYAIHDPRTPWASKILPWLALAYALSPLDLIPDFIPVLGFLDDMLLLPALLWLAVKLIPAEIMADARRRARDEPLRLHRNWVAPAVVFVLWTGAALVVAHFAFRRWADAETLPYEWAVLAGTGGVCAIAFVTWLVTTLNHERRQRDEWSAALNAPLNPPDAPGSSSSSGGGGGGGDAAV